MHAMFHRTGQERTRDMQPIQKIIFHIVLIAGIGLIVSHYGHMGEAFSPADAQDAHTAK